MRHFTRNALKAAVAASLLAGASFAHAQIAVDVDINVEEITILYAFTDVDVNITSATLATLLNGGTCAGAECDLGGTATTNATLGGGNLNADFTIGSSIGAVAPVNSVNLVLQNVWAVRALGGTSTNTTVTIDVPGGNISGPAGSVIGVAADNTQTDTFADPGLGTPFEGDVTLNLDLSGVTGDGNHDGGADAGDTVYTVEVTAT